MHKGVRADVKAVQTPGVADNQGLQGWTALGGEKIAELALAMHYVDVNQPHIFEPGEHLLPPFQKLMPFLTRTPSIPKHRVYIFKKKSS
jgi:hypothetical protein